MTQGPTVEIETDKRGIRASVRADIDRVLPALTEQILQDCNYFCKEDQGGLIASSITASDIPNGDLIWDTLYANRQYWLPATSRDVNPNAAYMWCHKAYDRFHKDWEELVQRLIGGDGA